MLKKMDSVEVNCSRLILVYVVEMRAQNRALRSVPVWIYLITESDGESHQRMVQCRKGMQG